jgi:hypothetical protein
MGLYVIKQKIQKGPEVGPFYLNDLITKLKDIITL